MMFDFHLFLAMQLAVSRKEAGCIRAKAALRSVIDDSQRGVWRVMRYGIERGWPLF
jgi:hypothetical protein